ncbi:hypothetical protein [Streptomyces sp. NPDC018693]|uniref:hypothetical protein n=1 Tax=unclassified Streptomyces TaxID=2593676 RepID=UPI0037A140FE
MTVALERPASTRTRDPKELLNAVAPHITELTVNVFDSGMSLWDREIALLLRDHTMVRDMAERVLGNAVMYTIGCIEHPEVHLGVGKLVDIGVHQLILDTPVWWGICRLYNDGAYKHHAPATGAQSGPTSYAPPGSRTPSPVKSPLLKRATSALSW